MTPATELTDDEANAVANAVLDAWRRLDAGDTTTIGHGAHGPTEALIPARSLGFGVYTFTLTPPLLTTGVPA